MKLLKLLFIFLLALTEYAQANTGELSLRSDEIVDNNQISIGLNGSIFSLDTGTIQGTGPKIDFTHYFGNKINVEFFLATALSFEAKNKIAFIGLGGVLYYTALGQCYQTRNNVYINETLIASEFNTQTNCLRVGGGLQQYFLNGTKNIYSGAGIGLNAAYHFTMWNYYFKTDTSYSVITSSKNQLNHFSISLSLIFSL